jgi:Protein of unknown function (DUF4232)
VTGRPARRGVAALGAVVGVAAIAVVGGSIALGRPSVRPAVAVRPGSHPVPRCAERDLRVGGPDSAAETMPGIVAVIVFRNAGDITCSIEGWPKVAILGPRPRPAAVPIRYAEATGAWSIGRTRVVLRPGASAASSMLIGTPANASGCGSPNWAITPPHGTRRLTVHRQQTAPQVCVGDSIVVSPVYPGHAPRVSYPPSPAPRQSSPS